MTDVRLAFATVADLPADDGWLSARERAVVGGLAVAKRARDWRLGRWAARRVALAALPPADARAEAGDGIEVLAGDDGAPVLWLDGRVAPWTLSISHRDGLAMAALARPGAALGCDLERAEPRSDAFVRDYLTAEEAALVRAAPAADRPLVANVIWSAKECVLKATRQGLRGDPRAVAVELAGGGLVPGAGGADGVGGRDAAGWRRFGAHLDGRRYEGVWREREGWIHTVAVADRGLPSSRSGGGMTWPAPIWIDGRAQRQEQRERPGQDQHVAPVHHGRSACPPCRPSQRAPGGWCPGRGRA